MLRSLKTVIGYDIRATDGNLGAVNDFLFHDDSWDVKWLVADTGKWLPGRKVLIAPGALGRPDFDKKAIPVDQTRDEIKSAPDYDTDQPVSAQEEELGWDRYYRWVPYMAPFGIGAAPQGTGAYALPVAAREDKRPEEGENDMHLRSAGTVIGYRIGAKDGGIGHLSDFIVDDTRWTIDMFIADTRNWLPGRHVVLATEWVSRIVWTQEKVEVQLNRATIKDAPPYDPSEPVNEEFAGALYDYYGRPHAHK